MQINMGPTQELAEPNELTENRDELLNQGRMGDANKYFFNCLWASYLKINMNLSAV